MKKLKILELCLYSAGQDGVFTRVKNESLMLSNLGHEVKIFSSNKVKGKNETAPESDRINKVQIKRFPTIKGLFSESFMLWPLSLKKAIIEYQPDVIITHSYRHSHTSIAINAVKQLKCKTFLVTHAPFDRSSTRNIFSKIIVGLYDAFIGPSLLKKYDKIITITNWEEPYLAQLGIDKSKIEYIPNGINDIYFSANKSNPRPMTLLYTGRIAPIKNLEVVLESLKSHPNLKFTIFGPAEQDYLINLNNIIKSSDLKNVNIINKSFDSQEQISKLDSARFFILPSKSEGMPQSLIEAMARGKICIASDNPGSADIIQNNKNGFLFKNGDAGDLSKVLIKIKSMSDKDLDKVSKNAKSFAKQFSWSILIKKLNSLIQNKK